MVKQVCSGLIAAMAILLSGCSSNSDTVDVPKTATEGGNVVNDPALKQQLMGASGTQQQSGLQGQ